MATVKITIIGMDALGQSLGLALKSSQAPLVVTLHDREHSRASAAHKAGAGDRVEWNLPSAVAEADLVIVNEPVHQIRETFTLIAPDLRPDAVVTDTCSLKGSVLAWAEELLPESSHFVGGMPLVSTRHPNAVLFQQRRYAIIPQTRTVEAAVRLVSDTVSLLGASPLFIDASEHDSLVAAVQQLPAVTSAALLGLTAGSQSWKEMATMASPTHAVATAFPTEDATALALLLRYNRQQLGYWLDALQGELEHLRQLLAREDDGEMLEAHLARLIEAQGRWLQAQQQNPDVPTYADSLAKADETRGFARWFGMGRRRND